MKKLKEEVEKKGLKLSVTENGKDGKSKMIASCGFLENEPSKVSKEEGVTVAESVEALGVDLIENKSQEVGSERKSEEKKVQGEVLDYQAEQGFPEGLHESGCQEVVACRHDASNNIGSPCGWDVSHGEVEH